MNMIHKIFSKAPILVGTIISSLLLGNSPINAQTAIEKIPLDPNKQSIASLWVSEILNAVSTPFGSSLGPTASSRSYGILGTAMYDAWATYERRPISTLFADGLIDSDLQRPDNENTIANKEEAVSYAAFRVLNDIFPDAGLQARFANKMTSLGFDPTNTSTDLSTAAGVGNFIAQELLNFRRQDGSNQLNDYADTTGYVPENTVGNVVNIEAWTPENVPINSLPGDSDHLLVQSPLHPHWGTVIPFALSSSDQFRPPAPQPFLLDPLASADLATKTITRSDGTVINIDKSLIGSDINPDFIAQAQEVVDFNASLSPAGEPGVPDSVTADGLPGGKVEGETRKLIAEFWEDPSGTPFPAGTWMIFAQKILEQDSPDLDEDVPLFFNLGNAVFDAGVATWEAKYFYDYARPVRLIRELGELGLIGEDPDGDGIFTIFAWGGAEAGTIEIPVTEFLTYQQPTLDPSPPFPEYTSGHSAFSTAAAEVLRLFTGSDDFILGDGSLGLGVTFAPGESRFEPGFTPMNDDITLFWSTFTEAADESGISRLYGGIHYEEGDLNGRALGREVGAQVFTRASFLLNGGQSVPEPSSLMALGMISSFFLLQRFDKEKD